VAGELKIEVNDSYNILFCNGYLRNNEHLPEGIIAGSFSVMFKQLQLCHDFFRKYSFSDESLNDLKNAPDSGGFFLFIPANAKPSKPIHIACLIDESSAESINLRNLVIVEAGSSIELMIGYYSYLGKPCICNDVTEVALGEAATLNLMRLQKVNSSIGLTTKTTVHQAASSRMKTYYVNLGGNNIQNQLIAKLNDEKAEHFAYGLSLTHQNEHVDNNVQLIHASPDCLSKQLFKHILSDTSTGIFTGRIVVDKDAPKTVAYQRSSNIVLHSKAKMNIRPQLEIYADDVKCSHGATVGQLDAEALFYLRSRGIGETEAKKTLLQAFADEVLDNITCKQFRDWLRGI